MKVEQASETFVYIVDDDRAASAVVAGALACFVKPIDVAQFLEAVSRVEGQDRDSGGDAVGRQSCPGAGGCFRS